MSKGRILVIDDEPDIVDFLTTLFRDHGFETLSAYDGEAGLELARQYAPDLITLDITMPKKSGVAVFRDLRSDPKLSRVPVYIITGVNEFRQLVYSRSSLPPEGYMEKPIDPEALLRDIETILKNH
jgi:DNA-binding response OmpR family regulator